jgi:2'-5' RNA ligase
MDEPPLILTLKLDAESFERFDGLRRRHFPPALNYIPAHITLFHKLPGERLAEIKADVRASAGPPLPLCISGVRRLGRGVAYEVSSPALASLRDTLAGLWRERLSPQDRQPFRPHVTVQNKVEPALADALYGALRADFRPFTATGEGVLIWRYLGGPWALAAEVAFSPGP